MFGFITKPIGCLFSLIGSIVVFTLVLLVAGYALIAWFMPQIAANAVSEATGFPTTIGSSSLSLWKQSLELKNIRIDNPETYPEDDFLDIRSLSLTLDRNATDSKSLVFSGATLDIDTLTLVNLSPVVLNGNTIIRNLLQHGGLNPLGANAGGITSGAFAGQNNGAAAANGAPYANATQPYGATGYTGATPQANGGQTGILHFQPVAPPAQVTIPQLQTIPPQGAATPGTLADTAEQPRWRVAKLTVRINSVRLFQSNPQGSVLIHLPLRYEREFENVTSLRQVIPSILLDLQRRNVPLAPAGF